MPSTTINELRDLVQITLHELYDPRLYINGRGNIQICIGCRSKGELTYDEILKASYNQETFIKLIKNKVEGD